jgi:2-desacetyl-2-hydroxyethyl bacteriochlorophyllide A dehydrogenase
VTFVAPRTVEVRAAAMPEPKAGEVRVRTRRSAISPGTERLVYRGEIDAATEADATLEALGGTLAYPLAYGYSVVGEVEAVGDGVEDAWLGRRVFAFQPHTTHFTCTPAALVPLPDDLADEDAVFIPNLETAVTLVMDGRPMIGERVAVFGQGVVGLLTTALLARHPLARLVAVEPDPARRTRARRLGADLALDPADADALHNALGLMTSGGDGREAADGDDTARDGNAYRGADLVYELSGRPAVLNDALSVCGYGGRVVVGSWYGTKTAPLHLGGRFHRERMRVVSSQVSTLDPSLRGRWTRARRTRAVMALCKTLNPSSLITHRLPQADATDAYRLLDEGGSENKNVLQIVLTYAND